MSPEQLIAWVNAAQTLAGAGIDIAARLVPLFRAAHPEMTEAEAQAAYATVMADDAVRAALAGQASATGPSV